MSINFCNLGKSVFCILLCFAKRAGALQVLLDADYYALYAGSNDVTQATADLETTKRMVATIKGKFRSSVDELAKVLRCLDDRGTGACLPDLQLAGHKRAQA